MKHSAPSSIFTFLIAVFTIANLGAQAGLTESLRPDIVTEGDPLFSLTERMRDYNTPGLSLAVVDNFKLVDQEGYGLVAAGRNNAVSTETVFQAASISKLVNAVGIIRLVEKGELNLDQDVNQLLKSWKIPASKDYPNAVITTRMLLSHIAGLSTHGFGGYVSAEGLPSPTHILNKAKGVNSDAVRIIQEPGKAFRYSGGGIVITQLLVEDITGQPYEQYLQEEVLQPLGMSNSFYSVNQSGRESQLATAHLANGKALKNAYQYYPESAPAGLWTTPGDLGQLMIDLMLSLRGDEGRLLQPTSVSEMLVSPIEGQNNGLGLFIRTKGEQLFFEHSGSNEGFKAQFIGNTETGQGAIVMTNGEQFGLLEEVVNAVATVFEWESWFGEESTIPKNLKIDQSQWKAYAGHYVSTEDPASTFDISRKKGDLIMSRPESWKLSLLPIGQTKYLLKGAQPAVTVEFMPDGTLRVTQGKVTVFRKEK